MGTGGEQGQNQVGARLELVLAVVEEAQTVLESQMVGHGLGERPVHLFVDARA